MHQTELFGQALLMLEQIIRNLSEKYLKKHHDGYKVGDVTLMWNTIPDDGTSNDKQANHIDVHPDDKTAGPVLIFVLRGSSILRVSNNIKQEDGYYQAKITSSMHSYVLKHS
jgi:hypothetical protein